MLGDAGWWECCCQARLWWEQWWLGGVAGMQLCEWREEGANGQQML